MEPHELAALHLVSLLQEHLSAVVLYGLLREADLPLLLNVLLQLVDVQLLCVLRVELVEQLEDLLLLLADFLNCRFCGCLFLPFSDVNFEYFSDLIRSD